MKTIKTVLAAIIAAILLFNINFALADFGGADIYDSFGYSDFDVESDYGDYGDYGNRGYTRYNYYNNDYDNDGEDDEAWDIVIIVFAAIIIISAIAFKFNKNGVNPTSVPT